MPKTDSLHDENLRKIQDVDLRVAYLYLIRSAEHLVDYKCAPRRKGYFNDFRYYRGKDWPFAFIINKQKGLLFYFRRASKGHKARSVEFLSKRYEDVEERSGEIRLRINNLDDAKRLMKDVFAYVD